MQRGGVGAGVEPEDTDAEIARRRYWRSAPHDDERRRRRRRALGRIVVNSGRHGRFRKSAGREEGVRLGRAARRPVFRLVGRRRGFGVFEGFVCGAAACFKLRVCFVLPPLQALESIRTGLLARGRSC